MDDLPLAILKNALVLFLCGCAFVGVVAGYLAGLVKVRKVERQAKAIPEKRWDLMEPLELEGAVVKGGAGGRAKPVRLGRGVYVRPLFDLLGEGCEEGAEVMLTAAPTRPGKGGKTGPRIAYHAELEVVRVVRWEATEGGVMSEKRAGVGVAEGTAEPVGEGPAAGTWDVDEDEPVTV